MMNAASALVPLKAREAGNIFFMLFGAVALVGVVGTVGMSVVRGPVATMSQVTKRTIAENDMLAASILLSEASLAQADADCDGDGIIEPIPYAGANGHQAPSGGGLIPMTIGAKKGDPWGNPYGYCAWDHGAKVKDNECGGADANRLPGGETATAAVIAVISSGPDRIFQTGCAPWVDDDTPVAERPANSDDMVHIMPYGQFLLPSRTRAQLEYLPDEACHTETVGTMRMHEGAVQVCTDIGWGEVGTSAYTDASFDPLTDAILDQEYTSNTISFQGFLNRRDVAVTEGAAVLVINGTPVGASGTIAAGDTIALRATSPPVPETTYTFAISVGGVRKVWTIRTRDFTPASLTITPTTQAMPITTPGTPGYGAVHSFIVRNTGETNTGPLLASQLSNTTNFEFHTGGSYEGDGCAAQDLAHDQTCVIDIRPRASDDGSYSGTLTVRTAALSAQATLSINASGWSCPVPWGGSTAHGTTITAWQVATAPWDGSCQSETRSCTLGELSGTYSHQACNVTPTTYAYGDWPISWGACSKTCGGGTQSRTRTCIRQNDSAVVDCSHCGGVCSQNQACNTQACCTRQPASGFYNWTSGHISTAQYGWYSGHGITTIRWNNSFILNDAAIGPISSYSTGGWTYITNNSMGYTGGTIGGGVARTNCY